MAFEYTIKVLQDRLVSLIPESEQGNKKISELKYAIKEISNWTDDEGEGI